MLETISLKLKYLKEFINIVLNFTEDTAKTFGLGVKETLAVRLATEEIFSYLCEILNGCNGEIMCKSYGYCIEITFLFKGDINLKAFNITATAPLDKDINLQEMGLLIAARQSDSFKIIKNNDGNMSLTLIKEKNYPEISDKKEKIHFEKSESIDIKKPDNEEIKTFVSNLNFFYSNRFFPEFLKFPGKIVDMINFGKFDILIATDEKQQIIGGIIWHWTSEKLIEFFGPYEFKKDIDEKLIIGFIEYIGKSDAIGAYSRLTFDKLSSEYFETIGNFTFYENGEKKEVPVYFRQLQEDSGAVTWSSVQLKEFLEKQYQNLFLPRKIEVVTDMGEFFPEYSILSANFYKFQKSVILNLIILGQDLEKNISEHIKLLTNESFENILFELDLGLPEQAYAINALYKNGFLPKVVIPCAGKGDIVVFHWGKNEF